jgi:hypothetical protein
VNSSIKPGVVLAGNAPALPEEDADLRMLSGEGIRGECPGDDSFPPPVFK